MKNMNWFDEAIENMDVIELRNKLRETLKRLDFVERRFSHIHVNAHDGTDICKQCGLDIRDSIHLRGDSDE